MAPKIKTGKQSPTKPLSKIEPGKSKEEKWLDDAINHESDSYKTLSTIRSDWPDKESMLLCKVEDKLSKDTKNDIFDPILSTMLIERTARVMAQNPTGQNWAVSKNDIGKNILMNHLHRYWRANANYKWSHLIKLRLMDFYSQVYGSMFALVPWWVDLQNGYVGPEVIPFPIRNARPQPGKVSPDESDWFIVKDRVSVQWLAKQNPEVWKLDEIAKLANELKDKEDPGDYPNAATQDSTSYIEDELFPTRSGDKAWPQIDLFTEYRGDAWLTWTPQRPNEEKSHPHILRLIENPYPEGMLPIVKKDAFPLIDSMIGLGDFERGKTLQFGVNSLWNLYLLGVKYSIFPPLHVDPNSVVPSSIKWGIGERWYMNRPNQDVQAMNMSPQGLNTFMSTYNYMQAAVFNLGGSTQVSQPVGAESSLGRTPAALKAQAFKESARDEWDRFMMEESLKQIYKRWTALGVENLDFPQTVRIFGAEIEDLAKAYPDEDILEVFDSKERGNATVDKTRFMEPDKSGNLTPVKFDFELDAGSTLKSNPEEEGAFLQALLDTYLKDQGYREALAAKGKEIDVAELTKRIMMKGPTKDWDRILVDNTSVEQNAAGGEVGVDTGMAGTTAEVAPTPPTPASNGEFKDPDIAAAVKGAFPGNQVPPTAVPAA